MSDKPTSSAAGQEWSAQIYADNARFVADLGSPVLELLSPQAGERILDLGCGDGALTEKIKAAGCDVHGFDASPELLEAARARGLSVTLGDGQSLAFDREFDAVFSNAALHWMLKPKAVVQGVAKALKPNARFVAEFGGFTNVAAITTALRVSLIAAGVDGLAVRPWYFPSVSEYKALLETSGFAVSRIELVPRPTPLPTGMEGWIKTFGDPFLSHVPKAKRAMAVSRAIELMRPALCDGQGNWMADYVRLRFSARLTG